jgi:hypothetical protein
LAFSLTVVGLHFNALSRFLNQLRFTYITSSSMRGWKFYWEISWTGGAKCRGTSLIVATNGFLTKSSLNWRRDTCEFPIRRQRCFLEFDLRAPALENN